MQKDTVPPEIIDNKNYSKYILNFNLATMRQFKKDSRYTPFALATHSVP